MLKGGVNKKAQLSIFVLIAMIIIVAGIAGYFYYKSIKKPIYPSEIQEIVNGYKECVADLVRIGKDLAMQRGGYINTPQDLPEGLYFTNNFEFMGEKIPYWIYYDFNGISKEQIPSLDFIAQQIANWSQTNLDFCDGILINSGFEFEKEVKGIDLLIKDEGIEINLKLNLKLRKAEKSYLIKEIKTFIESELKKLWENAKKIFEYEKEKRFLENYTFDIISLYAPTTGFEIQCVPLTFDKEKIKKEIINGLEVNLERIKFISPYWQLEKAENKYFVNKLELDEGIFVNLLYTPSFPTKIEIYSSKDVLKFDPVGNQPGLNLLGFCYVPYHLVYDVKYALLVILSNGKEIFKFPLAIVIERNQIKQLIESNQTIEVSPICENKVTRGIIYTYNSNLKQIEADIYFKCLDQVCYIGRTQNGSLKTYFPPCINGLVLARSENYKEESILIDSNYKFILNLFLKELKEKEIKIRGMDRKEKAILFFEGPVNEVLNWPEQKKLNLSEGTYKVTLYVFKDKKIRLNQSSEICWDIPVFFGITKKQCTKISGMDIEKVVVGGGVGELSIDKTNLKANLIEIEFERFDEPETIEEIAKNYELIELSKLEIKIK